jgi:hypothetical protein
MKLIATVDELIVLCPNLHAAVGILIRGCNEGKGEEALRIWDNFRSKEWCDLRKEDKKEELKQSA